VKKAIVAELQQRIHVFGAFEGNIAAPATVAPAGSATRHELFAAEGHTTISALTAGNMDLGFVNEHVESQSAGQIAKPQALAPSQSCLAFCGEMGAR
jgi:hypothetical protein